MSAPNLCECGARIRVVINPHRNPRSRHARRGQAVRLAGHDLCHRCWGAMLTDALAKQRRYAAAFVAVLVLAVLSAGCVQRALTGPGAELVLKDLRGVLQVAEASRELLPPTDPWAACAQALIDTALKLQAGPGVVPVEFNGPLTEAMRLHVLDVVIASASTEAKAACGVVWFQLMLRGAQRAVPGL